MVEINFTFLIFTVSFLVFIGLMKICFFDRVATVIRRRESQIESNLSSARDAAERSKAKYATNNAIEILSKAKLEAQSIINTALESANNQKIEMIEEIKLKIQNSVNTEKQIISEQKNQVLAELNARITELVDFASNKFFAEVEGREVVRA